MSIIPTEQSFLTAGRPDDDDDDDRTRTKNDKKVDHRSFSSLSYIIGTIVVGLVATIYLASGGGGGGGGDTSGTHMLLSTNNNNNNNNSNNNDEAAAAATGEIAFPRSNVGKLKGLGFGGAAFTMTNNDKNELVVFRRNTRNGFVFPKPQKIDMHGKGFPIGPPFDPLNSQDPIIVDSTMN